MKETLMIFYLIWMTLLPLTEYNYTSMYIFGQDNFAWEDWKSKMVIAERLTL